MRILLTLLLIGLLASCPILCGAAACAHPVGSPPHAGDDGPIPCPVEEDGCLCNGATKADIDLRGTGLDPTATLSPLGVPGAPTTSTAPPPAVGSLAGFGGDAGPVAVRARLQDFRC